MIDRDTFESAIVGQAVPLAVLIELLIDKGILGKDEVLEAFEQRAGLADGRELSEGELACQHVVDWVKTITP